MTQVDFDTFVSLFHHIVLPAKLPGNAENELHVTEKDLIRRLIEAIDLVKHALGDETAVEYDTLRKCIQTCDVLNEDGRLKKSTLLDAFQEFEHGDSLVLHVKEQNAGLLIYRKGLSVSLRV